MPYLPKYCFYSPSGIWIKSFAYLPTFMHDGRIIWLKYYYKMRVVKHHYLDGPFGSFWHKTDY